MTNEELIQLSDTLKAEADFTSTHFKVMRDEQHNLVYLQANRKGLLYAAGNLLYAAGVLDEGEEDRPQRRYHTFDWEELAEEGEWPLEHVELIDESGLSLSGLAPEVTMKDRLTGWGLAIGVILMLLAMIVGVITMGKWLIG